MRLCDKLNAMLKERGMSQADFARETGFSTAKISQLCSGATKDPRISTVILICDYFECSLSEFLEGVDLFEVK